MRLSRGQINTLNLELTKQYKKTPKHYINVLIIDIDDSSKYTKIQNTCRYLAARKIKHIIETNTHNTLHKRH